MPDRFDELSPEDILQVGLHALARARQRRSVAGTAVPAYAAGLLTVSLAVLAAEADIPLREVVSSVRQIYRERHRELRAAAAAHAAGVEDPRCPRCEAVDAGRESGLCVTCAGIVAREGKL
jgi:hypothetical protein